MPTLPRISLIPEALMDRRTFGAMTAAFIASPIRLSAYLYVEYSPTNWAGLKHSEQTIILNFRAHWSLTCERNLELIANLLKQNQAYQKLIFVDIDWDTYGQSIMATKLNVTRQSTLLAMKNDLEIARLVNQPYERKIRHFFDVVIKA